MPSHFPLFLLGQRTRFQEDHVIRPDLSDVVDARRVANQLDLRVLQPHPPRESLRERRNTLRVTVGVGIAEVDEIGQLQDRALGLFPDVRAVANREQDRKSTRLNSSHTVISYAVFCLKKKKKKKKKKDKKKQRHKTKTLSHNYKQT